MLRGFFGPYFEEDNGAPAGGDGAPDPTPASGGNAGGDAKFTQADLDRLINERLNREGIKDLKKKATEYDKIKASEQTEAEKVAAREQAAAEKEQALTKREQAVELRDEITRTVAAEKLTLQAPVSDVLRLLDTDAVTWENGKPVNVGTLIKQLVKERPYLIAKRSGSADGGEGDGTGPKKTSMNEFIRGQARGE